MKITREQLTTIASPVSAAKVNMFLEPINIAMNEFGIDSKLRVAAFLSQILHESGRLVYVKEIASGAAYDNRADLGNTSTEAKALARAKGTTPGRLFKGRGLIQTTGYNNYVMAMMQLNIDCVNYPELLEQPLHAVRAAAMFWWNNNLNKWADVGDIDGVSDVINKGRKTKAYGDTNGWDDRKKIYDKAMKIL